MSRPASSFKVGVAWAYVQALVARSVSLLGFLVAGFFLNPTQFGEYALAAGFLLVAEMLCEQSWTQCVVQRAEQREADSGLLLLLALGMGGLASLLMGLGAQAAAVWLEVPGAAAAMVGLSLCPLLMALTVLPSGRLRSRLDFRALTRRTALAGVVSVAIGCLLLWQGYGIWALIAQANVYWLTSVLVLWWSSPDPVVWSFDRKRIKELVSLASANSVSKFSDVFEMRVIEYAVATSLGAAALGAFVFAMRLAQTLFQLTANPAFEVSLAALAKATANERPALLKRGVLLITTLSAAALLALSCWGPAVLESVYGTRWAGSIGVLQVLALAFIARGILYLFGVSLQATGAAGSVMAWSAARALLLGLLCWALTRVEAGLPWFAAAYGLAALVMLLPFWRLLERRIPGSAATLRPFGADGLLLTGIGGAVLMGSMWPVQLEWLGLKGFLVAMPLLWAIWWVPRLAGHGLQWRELVGKRNKTESEVVRGKGGNSSDR